jgi:regulator of protease activity HflC (stomatin/prohibitin superfamily)
MLETSGVGITKKVLTFFGLYTLNADECGVKLFLGSYTGNATAGLGFAIPFIQSVIKTKSSIQTIDLPNQKIVLEGNIAVKISGSVNFRVQDPKKAILEVNDYAYSLKQLALTTISEVLGSQTIESIRAKKKEIADEIEGIIHTTAKNWGLSNVDIRLTDAEMDDSLLRAMMRETEAEKESKAAEIKAGSDKVVAEIFADAARTLAESPGALTLRVLQSLTDMSNSKSTIVMPIPIEMFPGLNKKVEQVKSNSHLIAEIYSEGGDKKMNCPYCGKKYNANNVVGNYKLDKDPSTPGIQLKCKQCGEVFTVGD